MKITSFIRAVALFTLLADIPSATSQGMPKELHDNIHSLFDNHARFTRKVELTEKGYIATTESTDPELARILREHVSQMRDRLQGGRMVRRWDPAFPEFIAHYDDITHRVEATKNGLRISVTGKTPDAIKVAKNHAMIVSDFAKNGWKAHDTHHPLALTPTTGTPQARLEKPAGECAGCIKEVAKPAACEACRKGATKQTAARPCCLKEAKATNPAACDNCRKETQK